MAAASDNVFPKIIVAEGAAPATPSSGQVKLYAKTDGLLYSKDDAGTETLVSGGVGGGGGLTQAYVGYNTAGSSWEQLTNFRVLGTKFTLAADCLATSVEAYLRNSASGTDDIIAAIAMGLYTDNAGTPQYLVASAQHGADGTGGVLFDAASGSTGDDTARWYGMSMGKWLAAGDYWAVIQMIRTTTPNMAIAYDGSGADRYYTSGGAWMSDWGWYAATTGSNKYSIRVNTIR